MGLIVALFIGTLLLGIPGLMTVLFLAGVVHFVGWLGLIFVLIAAWVVFSMTCKFASKLIRNEEGRRWEREFIKKFGDPVQSHKEKWNLMAPETSDAPHDVLH